MPSPLPFLAPCCVRPCCLMCTGPSPCALANLRPQVRLSLGRAEATLTEAEIDTAVQAVVAQLVARTGGRLRVG